MIPSTFLASLKGAAKDLDYQAVSMGKGDVLMSESLQR